MKLTVEFEFAPGDRCQLIEIDRPGMVTGCMRDSDGCKYCVVWWHDGQRRSEWLYHFEIRPCT